MKKLFLTLPVVLLLAASCNKTQPAQQPQNNNQQTTSQNYDVSASELADYFNAKFDCSAPKTANSDKTCFNNNFSSKNVMGVYDNPKYQLVDFTGDGYKDALVSIYYSGSGAMRDFYALTKDPGLTSGKLTAIYTKEGFGLAAANWSDSKGNYFLVGPQTLNDASAKTLTIHWDSQNKKFVEQNQATGAAKPDWKTYTYKNLSFQYPPQGWTVVFNSTVAGQQNGFDIAVVKESQKNSMQPNELTLRTFNDLSGTPTSYIPSQYRTFTKRSTGDSFIEFTVNGTPIYAGCAYYQPDKDTFDTCNQIVATINVTPDNSLAPNIFTYNGVKVGQKVGAMIVDRVGSMNGYEATQENVHVEFLGNVVLTGTLSAPTGNPEDAGMGPEYSINDLTTDSLNKLPYLKNDTRTVWFGIRNPEVVKNAGLKNRDKVAITIGKYYYNYLEAGVWNEADIVSIKKVQ